MKTLLNFLKRSLVSFEIRCIEIELNDVCTMIRDASNKELFLGFYMRREQLRKYLAAARSEYIALLPVGERKTWKTA